MQSVTDWTLRQSKIVQFLALRWPPKVAYFPNLALFLQRACKAISARKKAMEIFLA